MPIVPVWPARLAALSLGIALAFTAAPARATTYYVAVGGSGSGSIDSPWGSLQSAVGSSSPVQAGDVISVAAGTYTLSSVVSFQKSGSPGQPITLKAEPGVVLNVTATSAPAGALDLDGLHDWVIDGLRIENAPNRGIGLHGCTNITIQNCTIYRPAACGIIADVRDWGSNDVYPVPQNYNVKILGNTIEQANWKSGDNEGISLWALDGFEVAGNTLIDCQREGIDAKTGARNGSIHHNTIRGQYNKWSGTGMAVYIDAWHYETFNIDIYDNLVYGSEEGFEINCEDCNKPGTTGSVHDIRIFNNIVYGNLDIQDTGWKGRAMSFYDCCDDGPHPVHDIHVFNNTFVGSELRGISVENPAVANLFISNNIIVNNGSDDIIIQQATSVTVTNNLLSKALRNSAGAAVTASGNVVADPKFVSLATNDYHLLSGSPAIDEATGPDIAAADFDGNARPAGSAADIGAYEFGASPAGTGGVGGTQAIDAGPGTGGVTGTGGRLSTGGSSGSDAGGAQAIDAGASTGGFGEADGRPSTGGSSGGGTQAVDAGAGSGGVQAVDAGASAGGITGTSSRPSTGGSFGGGAGAEGGASGSGGATGGGGSSTSNGCGCSLGGRAQTGSALFLLLLGAAGALLLASRMPRSADAVAMRFGAPAKGARSPCARAWPDRPGSSIEQRGLLQGVARTGQGEPEGAALACLAVHADASTVSFDRQLAEGKSETERSLT